MSKIELISLHDPYEDFNESDIEKSMELNFEMNSEESNGLFNFQGLNKGLNSEELEKDKATPSYFHVEIF